MSSEPERSGADDLCTVDEAATLLRCRPETVRRYIADHRLPAARVGGRLLIARQALVAIVIHAGGGPGGGPDDRDAEVTATMDAPPYPTMNGGGWPPR